MREYSIPHLRRSGRISIPEESFERIREARDLHKEGLGTGSVRRLLREGGSPHTGELKERIDQLSENLERLRDDERPVADEGHSSYALRTILARQNLLISAMFNLTEMVEELLFASGKPRKAVFDDVEGEIRKVISSETPEGVPATSEPALEALPARQTRFGSLSRRRRLGVLAVLSALLVGLLLTWALPTLGSELASGLPFSDGRESEKSFPDAAVPKEGAMQDSPASDEAPDTAAGSEDAERVKVPDVSDRNVMRAGRVLSRAGFEVDAIKSVASREETGMVTGTEPAAGSAVEPGGPVVLVMSGGPSGIPPEFRERGAGDSASAQYAN